jgi:hypothetical protein
VAAQRVVRAEIVEVRVDRGRLGREADLQLLGRGRRGEHQRQPGERKHPQRFHPVLLVARSLSRVLGPDRTRFAGLAQARGTRLRTP